jgi:hypothetical protein
MTPEQIHMLAGTVVREAPKQGEKVDGVWYPLSVLIRGSDFVKELAKTVPNPYDGSTGGNPLVLQGDYQPEPGEKIISLGRVPKDEFMDVMRQSGIYSPHMWQERDRKLKAQGAKNKSGEAEAPEAPPESIPITKMPAEEFKGIMLPALGLPPIIPGVERPKKAAPAPIAPKKPPQPPIPKQGGKKGGPKRK